MRRLLFLVVAFLVAGPASAGGEPVGELPTAVRLPVGDEASVQWDLAAHFASGHRLYARFLVTNAGPGEHTALAFGHLLRPDGATVDFRNGRREGRWQLSDDARRLTLGSSVLDLGDEARHFEVDNDKRGVKIHLDFPADGSAWDAASPPAGYRFAVLNLATPAEGRFWLEGMAAAEPLTGHVLLTRTRRDRAEAELLERRIDAAVLDPEAPLLVSHLDLPGGERWAFGAARGGVIPDLVIEATPGTPGAYPVPASLGLRGKGIDGAISLGATRLEVDPIEALPALVRMVYSFGGRPLHRWVEAEADVALKSPDENAVLRYQGAGFAALSYPDRTPPNDR